MDRDELEQALGRLPGRVFVLHNVHAPHPIVFMSRWAMSFLRGPLTKQEIRNWRLGIGDWGFEVGSLKLEVRGSPSSSLIPPPSSLSLHSPTLPPDVPQFFLPPTVAVEWAVRQWEEREGAAALVAEKRLVYAPHWLGIGAVRIVDRKHGVDHRHAETRLQAARSKTALIEWEKARETTVDAAALHSPPAEGALYEPLPAGVATVRAVKALSKDFTDYLYHNVAVSVPYNSALKIAGRPGDKPREFRARCEDAARAGRDAEIDRLRKSYERQIARVEEKIDREQRELERDTEEHRARKREENWALAETAWNFLRGRRPSYAVAWAMRRSGNTGRAQREIDESEDELADLREALADLRQSLEEEIAEVSQKWVDLLEQVEEIRLTPRRSDVSVDVFGLAWLPRWRVTLDVDGQKRQVELDAYDIEIGDWGNL